MTSRVGLLVCASLLVLSGCSSSGTTSNAPSDSTASDADGVSGKDATGQQEVLGDHTSGTCEVGLGELKTTLGSYTVFAGESVGVDCAFEDCEAWNDEGL
mgnify:CR=1 FL=1